jgi:drug/metabolite transporter (DMT)-like permease
MPAQEGSFKFHLEVITGSIIYGTIGVFLDRIQDISVGAILFSRYFFGLFMIFSYLLLIQGTGQLKLGKNKKYLLLMGFLNSATAICYFSSIRYSGVSVAVLLLYTSPVYVSLLSPLILKEKNSDKSLLPLLLAIAGVFMIAHPGDILMNGNTGSDFQKGLVFGLLSGFSSGMLIIFIRYLRHDYTGVAQTFWMTGISLLFMLPSALLTPAYLFIENLNILILFGFTITFAAVIFLLGISGVKAQTGSILALVEPVSGIFFDITVLKNPLYISTLLGCFFILAAAYIVSRRELGKGMKDFLARKQKT